MPVPRSAVRRVERAVDLGVLAGRRAPSSASARVSMPSRRRNRAWLDRAVHARAEAVGGMRQRLEIDMRGEVDLAGLAQRIDEVVAADRLQRVADGALRVAIVDHQRGAALSCATRRPSSSAIGVGAPFEDRADRRVAQCRRQHLVEQRDRIAGDG